MGIFINEPGCITVPHRDHVPWDPQHDEFLWLAPDNRKLFWVWDDDNNIKVPITSGAAFFSSCNIHAIDPCPYPSYSIRIDGVFTETFKQRTGMDGWKDQT